MSDASEPARSEPASSGATDPEAAERPAPEPGAAESTEETLALPPTTADREPTAPSPIEEYPAPAGVPVPFAAPPTERDRGRFATKLVLGIVGGVVLIVAVVAALGISSLLLVNSVYDRIEETAVSFMDDVGSERWDQAHNQLCPSLRDEPVESFVDEWESWDAEGAEVVSLRETSVGGEALMELEDGSRVVLDLRLDQSDGNIDASVCGWDHEA